MLHFLLLFFFFTFSLFSLEMRAPVKVCPTFNNLKHTKNSHNVMLDMTKTYVILDHHKGQYLILVKGEQPAQRWVDERCFSMDVYLENSLDSYIDKHSKEKGISTNTNKYDKTSLPHDNLLALSWHNAFCESHRHKKECKRNVFTLYRSKHRESHFILHGLWPQPANRAYCGVEQKFITMDKYKHWNKLPEPKLSEETYAALSKHMPGVASNLHRHEWIKHGTCSGLNAESYFNKAMKLVDTFHHSEVSSFFEKNMGKRITIQQVRKHFDQSFGTGAGERVDMRCHKGLVTELWLHLGGESDALGTLLRKGKKRQSKCKRGFLDKAGFTKETNRGTGFGR